MARGDGERIRPRDRAGANANTEAPAEPAAGNGVWDNFESVTGYDYSGWGGAPGKGARPPSRADWDAMSQEQRNHIGIPDEATYKQVARGWRARFDPANAEGDIGREHQRQEAAILHANPRNEAELMRVMRLLGLAPERDQGMARWKSLLGKFRGDIDPSGRYHWNGSRFVDVATSDLEKRGIGGDYSGPRVFGLDAVAPEARSIAGTFQRWANNREQSGGTRGLSATRDPVTGFWKTGTGELYNDNGFEVDAQGNLTGRVYGGGYGFDPGDFANLGGTANALRGIDGLPNSPATTPDATAPDQKAAMDRLIAEVNSLRAKRDTRKLANPYGGGWGIPQIGGGGNMGMSMGAPAPNPTASGDWVGKGATRNASVPGFGLSTGSIQPPLYDPPEIEPPPGDDEKPKVTPPHPPPPGPINPPLPIPPPPVPPPPPPLPTTVPNPDPEQTAAHPWARGSQFYNWKPTIPNPALPPKTNPPDDTGATAGFGLGGGNPGITPGNPPWGVRPPRPAYTHPGGGYGVVARKPKSYGVTRPTVGTPTVVNSFGWGM